MAAVEKLTSFGERQLFSEQTQFLKIFALELEFRFQPVRVDGMRFVRITGECQRNCNEADIRQMLSKDRCTPHCSHTKQGSDRLLGRDGLNRFAVVSEPTCVVSARVVGVDVVY